MKQDDAIRRREAMSSHIVQLIRRDPRKFKEICEHFDVDPRSDKSREIDRALQYMRKKNIIRYIGGHWHMV